MRDELEFCIRCYWSSRKDEEVCTESTNTLFSEAVSTLVNTTNEVED